jgi:putative phage-type endonuclease
MTGLTLIQGSPEWHAARCGSLGASQVHDALTRTKTGWGAARANLIASIVVERLTGQPTETVCSPAMQWGKDKEPEARNAYAFYKGVEVAEVGLVTHPALTGTHASPDGLIGDDGLIEIKCPNTATHIETLTGAGVPAKYVTQMQWQMACTGRAWCDFVSFDPRLPAELSIYIKRVERDEGQIAELTAGVSDFLGEVEAKLNALRDLQQKKAS